MEFNRLGIGPIGWTVTAVNNSITIDVPKPPLAVFLFIHREGLRVALSMCVSVKAHLVLIGPIIISPHPIL